MGEPRPPPGAPVLFLVLSLAGSGGGQENKAVFVDEKSFPAQELPGDSGSKGNTGAALGESKDHRFQDWLTRLKLLTQIPRASTFPTAKVEVAFETPGLETTLHRWWLQERTGRDACPAQQLLQKLLHPWERLPLAQQLRAYARRRRAAFLPHPALRGTHGQATKEDQSRLAVARPTFREEEEDAWKPADTARRTLPNHPGGASLVPGHHHATKRGMQPPLPSVATEVEAAHKAGGCRCPESQRAPVAAQETEALQGALRVPTPRTEEAAWAASALTFLLVLLTLAVLYTRMHRKCRRGPSLYWMTSSEEGRETVAGKPRLWHP
ncbi:tumor protein p53-inducible protein 13, partial [Thamnophis elegans]|uniref:tumor protein p53-inducible protein 13 n=1 Tax=Thamnophis elegans TaxID=35005 RepID=UPI001379059B